MADSAGARRREVENREALWLKVFGNGLILREIEKYLGYTDLKLCREVSSRFNRLILEETDFRRRTVVNIKRQTIEDNVLETWDWKIKAVRVVPAMPDRYVMRKDKSNRYLSKDLWMERKMKTVYSKMADVESLMFLQEECEDVENCRGLVPNIYETLTATEMLIELRISNDFIKAIADTEEDGDGEAEAREKVQARISTVEALDIDITNYALAVVPSVSFQQLRRLRRLKIVPEISEQLMESDFVENGDVRGLMELNQGLLEALVMKHTRSTLLDGLVFPKLKTIHIGVFAPHTASIITFLGIHKNQLEDLYLRTHGSAQHRLLDVLNTLKELNPQLRALGIRVRKEWLWAGLLDLDRFVRLEEFHLELTVGFRNRNDLVNVEYATTLFKRLPSTLKKIRILRPWEQHESALPIAEIQSLRNVTSLYMESFNHSLTDDALHAVFCNMVQLRELRIWRAAGITDVGFRGLVQVDENWTVNPSFSLGNLKGLTHLEIRCCDLSDATVLNTIKFLGLRYLDIRNNKRITAASFYAALEQNPSLEGFQIDRVVSLPSLKRVISFVRNKYPRLQQCEAIFGPPLCRHDGYLRDLQIELRQMIMEGMMDIMIQLGMQEESNVPRMFRAILQLYEF